MDLQLLDGMWVLVCSALVMVMQAGFLCLETGLSRKRNHAHIALKTVLNLIVCFGIFILIGHKIAFGSKFNSALQNGQLLAGSLLIFQSLFCATSLAIVSGAIAERCRVHAYLIIVAFASLFIYAPVVRAVWSQAGILQAINFIDFAGGTVVHVTGGMLALIGIVFVGPRAGRFQRGFQESYSDYSGAWAVFGSLLLWIGWLGFNAGSFGRFDDRVPLVIANTLLAGIGSSLALIFINLVRSKRHGAREIVNSLLCGAVAITAGVDLASPTQALLIGSCAGIVGVWFERKLISLHLDDAVGAIPVHLGAGVFGTFAVSFLDRPFSELSGINQFGIQLIGVSAVISYVSILFVPFMIVLGRFVSIRTSMEMEALGLDITEHGVVNAETQFMFQMSKHAETGDFSRKIVTDPHSDIGALVDHYNSVLDRLDSDKLEVLRRSDALVGLGIRTSEIAHEIKSPLQSVMNYLAIMRLDAKDQKMEGIETSVKSAEDQISRVNDMISSLLSSTSESFLRVKERFGVHALVEDAVKLSWVYAHSSKIQLETVLPEGTKDLRIFGYRQDLLRTLCNLIENAIESLCTVETSSKVVRLKVDQQGRKVVIDVSDNGPGVSQGNLVHIFKLFFTTKPKGTGMGLFLSRRSAQIHGGSLSYQYLDGWSQFRLSLPADEKGESF